MSNIFIAGKAGAGKTLVSNYLQKERGFKAAKMAYPVYAIANNYFLMKGKDRQLLQIIGSDIGRELINKRIWVDRLLQDIDIVRLVERIKTPNENSFFVVDDVRFTNEAEALLDLGWKGVYLDVPDEIRIQRLTYRDNDPQTNHLHHISETSIDNFKDKLIKVDGTLTPKEIFAIIDNIILDININ